MDIKSKRKKRLVIALIIFSIVLCLINFKTIARTFTNTINSITENFNKGNAFSSSHRDVEDYVNQNKELKDKKVGLAVPAYNYKEKNGKFEFYIENIGDVEALCSVELFNSKTNESELVYTMKEVLKPKGKENIVLDLSKSKIGEIDSISIKDTKTIDQSGLVYSIRVLENKN